MKKALIFGISGQDGSYLAKFLIEKGYLVLGTSRNANIKNLQNLQLLGIYGSTSTISLNLNNYDEIIDLLEQYCPDEIYYLAGQSSVSVSFEQPLETIESCTSALINILEAVKSSRNHVKLYHASSSECFGELQGRVATEHTSFEPRSPYAIAKASSHWLIKNYRDAQDLFLCNGILFNHESPLRPANFVTKKIVSAACRIANGSKEKLNLGRLDISRDWGWAPEYVEAMWRMLQMDSPDDYIIATGKTHSLKDFVRYTFEYLTLNWQDHVEINKSLFRGTDITSNTADPSYAEKKLKWKASLHMYDVIKNMINAEANLLKSKSK